MLRRVVNSSNSPLELLLSSCSLLWFLHTSSMCSAVRLPHTHPPAHTHTHTTERSVAVVLDDTEVKGVSVGQHNRKCHTARTHQTTGGKRISHCKGRMTPFFTLCVYVWNEVGTLACILSNVYSEIL